jgi:hypothetical protein
MTLAWFSGFSGFSRFGFPFSGSGFSVPISEVRSALENPREPRPREPQNWNLENRENRENLENWQE